MDSGNHQRIVNYCRILHLLRRGESFLHKIFRNRWESYQTMNNKINKWNDDKASGKELISLNHCTSAAPKMKDLLQSGNVELWDITLTNLAIQAISKEIKKFGGQIDKNEDKLIKALRETRNEIAHGKSELTDDEFIRYWNQLEDILVKFGDEAEEINKIKENFNQIGQVKVEEANPKSEFIKQKNEANKLFIAEKYIDAIKAYDKILQLPGLLPENQALIFSNRSIAYLKLKDENSLKMAKRDAEWTIQLWPCWWRGYFRLGQAEAKLGELSKAMEALEKALALNHQSKEVLDELSAVRHEHGIISRFEHLIPASQPFSYDAEIKECCRRQGISEEEYRTTQKLAEKTPLGDIWKGHQYRDGEGVPQDYIKAAGCYAKAAHLGFPEAMYNLAMLYESGKGVKRDFDEAFRWYQKAASSELVSLCGVAHAQHVLGLKYTNGVGVEKNFKKAVEWYEKAVKHGYAPSANNLGILYQNGQGVERSLKKAFQYFKISAQGGDTAAMGNLANCYFSGKGTNLSPTKEDIAEGIKWLKIAAEKGDMVAAKKLEKMEKLTDDEILEQSLMKFFMSNYSSGSKCNPLDEKQFGKEVEQAAKNGSIIAKRQLEIWKNLRIAMEAFKQNDQDKLILSLSTAIRLDHQIVEVPDILHPAINKYIETYPTNIDAITCFIRINTKNAMMPHYVYKYMEMYPFDEYLIEMSIASFIGIKKYDAAIEASTLALKWFPHSLRFIYMHAIALCMHSLSDKSLEYLDKFLAMAPKDHEKVPACHYRKASYFLSRKQVEKFVAAFEAGLAAEKEQLPCFLPYQFPMKDMLLKDYTYLKFSIDKNITKNSEQNDVKNASLQIALPVTAEDLKNNPQRKIMITNNRDLFIKLSEKDTDSQIRETVSVLPNAPKPPKLTSLKSITLKDINPIKDKVYDGYVLEAKIIDWSYVIVGISTIIEDENGDIQRMVVYNWCPTVNRKKYVSKAIKDFRPNVMVSIINPYMRIAKDDKSIIRVESPVYIRLDDTLADKKCTFCGKEAKVLPCSKCLITYYCSKECQKFDWIEFNHRGICKHLKHYSSNK